MGRGPTKRRESVPYPRQARLLRYARKALGLRMADMASAVGFSAAGWWYWEAGLRRVNAEAYRRLRAYYREARGRQLQGLRQEAVSVEQ